MREGYQRTFITAKLCPSFGNDSFKAVASEKKYDIPKLDGITPDLELVHMVLASEQNNLNGDFFNRSELIMAAKTPINKPFNIEHIVSEDESYVSQPIFNRTKNTIIGHMINSALAKKDGTIIKDEEIDDIDKTNDIKRAKEDCLDIIASAVLYSFIFPKTVEDIKAMANDSKMFVSMECWFKGYDFLVNGELIENTEENSKELTEKWSKGVKGEDGKRICRVLKDIIFGAVAATPTPANPESIFLSVASYKQEIEHLKRRHNELHILQSIKPSEVYLSEHNAIERSVATLSKKIEEIQNGK
jgi:hypothetical protein